MARDDLTNTQARLFQRRVESCAIRVHPAGRPPWTVVGRGRPVVEGWRGSHVDICSRYFTREPLWPCGPGAFSTRSGVSGYMRTVRFFPSFLFLAL